MKSMPAWNHKIVRVKLSWLWRTPSLWMGKGAPSNARRSALRFLFRPRSWVRAASQCILTRHGLRAGSFITTHLRQSQEKTAELRVGHQLPPLRSYVNLTIALGQALGVRDVFVQTSSSLALDGFVSLLGTQSPATRPSYTTGHARSENDLWGGWQPALAMEQSVVAAVNAHISSLSAGFVSTTDSAWTEFVGHLMVGVQPELEAFGMVCRGRNASSTFALTTYAPAERHLEACALVGAACGGIGRNEGRQAFGFTTRGRSRTRPRPCRSFR